MNMARAGRDVNHGLSCIIALLIYTANLFALGSCNDEAIVLSGPEHKLYTDLFTYYNHESRPVKNASHSVTVTFALSLNQLLDLDEKNQVLTTSVWIYEEWQDESLTWSPEKYDGQSALMIPASVIWLPDVFIFNTAGPNMNGFVNVNGSKVAIQHDGNVKWMVPLMVASACAVDVTYFPYDRQVCEIKFGSWIYDIAQLNILIDSDKPDLEHYVMNSEYDLEKVSLERGVLGSSCCPGEGRHPMVKLTMRLRRKSLYYDYIVIAPTIMLCVMTLASFLLPCDRGEKMNIGLTVFLTLYVLQLRIADNVPDTNSTPILGVFMLVVMTFNCVSLIMATIVMNIKKLGDGSPCPDVPKLLFAFCQHVIGRVVCTPYIWAQDTKSEAAGISKGGLSKKVIKADKPDDDEAAVPMIGTLSADVDTKAADVDTNVTTRFTNDNLITEEHGSTSGGHYISENAAVGTQSSLATRQSNSTIPKDVKSKQNTTESLKLDPVQLKSHAFEKSQLRHRQRDITKREISVGETTSYVNPKPLGGRKEQTKNYNALLSDRRAHGFLLKKRWFYVAEVVDKFLFVVYLVLLTTSIFTVLFLIPVYFRDDE